MAGNILSANENFCQAMGYRLDEIVGRPHSMFVEPGRSEERGLCRFLEAAEQGGGLSRRQYKRIGEGGREVWIEASYNPVFKGSAPYKVVKFATVILLTLQRS